MIRLDSPKMRGQRVQAVRVLCGTTVAEFCDTPNVSLSKGSVNHWESPHTSNGISKVGVHKIIQRAQELGVICSFEWIMYGIGMPPVYQGGIKTDALAKEETMFLEAISAFCDQQRILHITVQDDAMAPEYQVGDMVIGIKQNKAEDAVGQTCLIVTQDHQVLLRKLDKGNKHRSYILRPANPLREMSTLYEVKIKIAAPVVFRWRRT